MTSQSTLSTDPTLSPFLSPTFSPITYLNSHLPTWTPSSTTPTPTPTTAPSTTTNSTTQQSSHVTNLQDLTTTTQTLLTTLDAKLSRLTATLTQLTDDILRSGGRLDYEVEILRSDAGALDEVVKAGWRDNKTFGRFVEGGEGVNELVEEEDGVVEEGNREVEGREDGAVIYEGMGRPPALAQLHTLSLLRSRLQTVIQTFDDAIAWPLPPSATRSNIVSVTAPTNGQGEDLEGKGRAFEAQTKEDIADLLDDGAEGIEAARRRVRELRELCAVWRGTGEERARRVFVEELERLVGEVDDVS